jgi:hypothetical protein
VVGGAFNASGIRDQPGGTRGFAVRPPSPLLLPVFVADDDPVDFVLEAPLLGAASRDVPDDCGLLVVEVPPPSRRV